MRVDWYRLILDAQMCRGITLQDDQIWYVCAMLDEHVSKVELVDFYAFEYQCGAANNNIAHLKIIGDFSIISAGFFSQRLAHYGISREYYLGVGKNAYGKLADIYYIKNNQCFVI